MFVHETHHLCRYKRTLVYNFFDCEKDAMEFITKHQGSHQILGAMSYHYRDWHKSMLPPVGTKSYWHGEFGNHVYSQWNQL